MILLTGAAGKTGRAILNRLVGASQPVRAFVRSQQQRAIVSDLGAAETVVGDLEDRDSLERALAGVNAVYHICPNMHPHELPIGANVIAAAMSNGVERFVYHSVLHPQVEAMPHHWQKMRVEERLFEAGLTYTILQPAAYMQNVLANWDRIVGAGIYELPYSLDAPLSLVDLAELAEVAAKVLLESGHEGAVYELCSAEIYSPRRLASLMGRRLGREVTAERISLAAWERKARAAALGDYALTTLLQMFRYYDQHGLWGSGRVLRWLLGRPAATFDTFLERIIAG